MKKTYLPYVMAMLGLGLTTQANAVPVDLDGPHSLSYPIIRHTAQFWGDEKGHRPRRIRRMLRDRGFSNIEFIDRRLPRYVVRACRGPYAKRLVLDRWGRIRKERNIGRCLDHPAAQYRTPIHVSEIRTILRAAGYNRIHIFDRQLPWYVAKACKRNKRFTVTLNRFGDITNRTPVGRCGGDVVGGPVPGRSLQEIRSMLSARGYHRIRVIDGQLPVYGMEACKRGRLFKLKLNRFGEIRKRKRSGWCAPGGFQVRPAPRREYIEEREFERTEKLHASRCQDYFDWLLDHNTVYFDIASAKLKLKSIPLLKKLAMVANRCPRAVIEIAGHTDSDGSTHYNQRLSEQRAASVVGFLLHYKVSPNRLSAVGYGELHPVAPNTSAANKALNRRIEFTVEWDDDAAGYAERRTR